LSGSLEKQSNWTYRILTRRLIVVKAKNPEVRKLTATDLQTNLPFAIDVPQDVPMEEVEAEKSYFASLKVYTAKDTKAAAPEYSEFFGVLDVDQPMEDFLKVYWIYPKLIKFELSEVQPSDE
jgi:hypothetical protein